MNENFFTEKELKKVNGGNVLPKVVITLLVLAVLALAFFLGKKYLFSRNTIKLFIDNYFETADANLDSNITSQSIDLDFTIKNSFSDEQIFKILNNTKFYINTSYDSTKKISNTDINLDYYGDSLIKMNSYITNDTMYFYFTDLYDKYIELDNEDIKSLVSSAFSNNNSDIKTIINSIHTSLDLALKDEYFTTSRVKIDGKKLNKTELLLDNNNYKQVMKDIIDNLKSDNNFIDSYAKLSNKTSFEVISLLNETLDNVNSSYYDSTKISLYTTLTDFTMLEIEEDNGKITIKKDNDAYSYDLYAKEDDTTVKYSGILKIKENNNTYNIVLEDDSNLVVEINLSTKKDITVEEKDISNFTLYSKLTDKDYEKIGTKLAENKAFQKLYKNILSTNLFGGNI